MDAGALDRAPRRSPHDPNPIVGACFGTPDGIVVGDGCHERAGDPHAEVNALEEAGERARGATLYCTLEPCVHTGRTGPCTERIIAAGIARVVAAMEDPFPLVHGRGFESLREHGIVVEAGVARDEAIRLNQPFLTSIREKRPFVILKAATSLDGRLAAAPGERTRSRRRLGPPCALPPAQVDAVPSIRHAARGRSAAHGTPGLPRTAVDPRVFDRGLRASPNARLCQRSPRGR